MSAPPIIPGVQDMADVSPPPRRRRRVVLWVSVGLAVLVTALVAVLATSTPSSQAPDDSSPLVGHPAPAVVGPDQSGATVNLSSYRGRWVLVNFAASWCAPCQEETPELLTFAARNQGPGAATIVTVEYDQSDLGSLRRFLASRHATWPVVDDPGAFVAYGGLGLPESFLVDPLGTVVAKITGGVNADQLDNLISRYPVAGAPASQ